jgi:hypothetical protein
MKCKHCKDMIHQYTYSDCGPKWIHKFGHRPECFLKALAYAEPDIPTGTVLVFGWREPATGMDIAIYI